MKTLSGGQLAGGNSEYGRVDNDFYATDPKAVETLLHNEFFNFDSFLEPCVGEGHIVEAVHKFVNRFYSIPYWKKCNLKTLDIINRGYPNTITQDFLTWKTQEKFNTIITNPPYSLAKEFIEKGMELLTNDGKMAMFLKIQFLEGAKRKELFDKYPPKYIYVFRNRMPTWNNGQPKDPKTGKKWATTMCHAWFIWEKGSTSEPVVRWL